MRTLAILPVKGFANAKQRLTTGLAPEQREALAEAMYRDVLAALLESTLVDRLLVVTRGSEARRTAIELGAEVVGDEERGHNAAALLGIRIAAEQRADRALLVPGDCPALDPTQLDELLSRPAAAPSVLIVPDRHGIGTNALVLTPPDALAPSFGPGSCARHARDARAGGVSAEVVEVRSLATDVDTPEDLRALEESLGRVGAAHTRRLLSSLIMSGRC